MSSRPENISHQITDFKYDFENDEENIKLLYITCTYNQDNEVIIYLKIDYMGFRNTEHRAWKEYIADIFMGPVLHSSDGEVRTFGFNDSFINIQENIFEYTIHRSPISKSLVHKFLNFEWDFHIYIEITNKFTSSKNSNNNIRHYNKRKINKEDYTINFVKYYSVINRLMIYYLYTKLIYSNDLSNIDSKDSGFIKYIDDNLDITESELNDAIYIFNDRIYTPYKEIYILQKHIIKMTPSRYDTEWNLNKFLVKLSLFNPELYVLVNIPGYEYFKYTINVDDFTIGNKLLFKLKFSNNKTLNTNVYIGRHVGKSIYQNLLDIKNGIENNIIEFKDKDFHNMVLMNFMNLRFLHLCGVIHNDLHLNNIMFNKENEFIPHGMTLLIAYKFRVFGKFYLHLGKIEFSIIDFGRACYIYEKDIILKRVKKINKEFYVKYLHAMNEKFEEDTKMTGYMLSLFDYIEYVQSIILGFRWINSNDIDFDKLQNVIDYCYKLLDNYFQPKNTKIVNKLINVLSVKHYKKMPDLLFDFIDKDSKLSIRTLCEKFLPSYSSMHPIDIVISKFFPENIMTDDKEIDQHAFLYEANTNS